MFTLKYRPAINSIDCSSYRELKPSQGEPTQITRSLRGDYTKEGLLVRLRFRGWGMSVQDVF